MSFCAPLSPLSPLPLAVLALSLLAAGCDSAEQGLCDEVEVAERSQAVVPPIETPVADEVADGEAAAAAGKAAAQDYIAFADAVKEHMDEANGCYKAALADDPSLEGRVVLAFTLAADGAVKTVAAEEDSVGQAVTECLAAAARGWSFPAPEVGPMALRYPFVFKLAEGGGEPGPTAKVRVAKGSSEGGLDRDIIRRIVRAHIDEVRACYNDGLGRDPGLEGRVVTEFKIDGEGRVMGPPRIATSVGDVEVDTCVAGAVEGWRFPKPRGGGEVLVTYPFVLSPG